MRVVRAILALAPLAIVLAWWPASYRWGLHANLGRDAYRRGDPVNGVGVEVGNAVDGHGGREAEAVDGLRERGVRPLGVGRELAQAAQVEDGVHTTSTRGAGAAVQFDGSASDHVRIGFAACNETELQEAVRRLAATLRS